VPTRPLRLVDHLIFTSIFIAYIATIHPPDSALNGAASDGRCDTQLTTHQAALLYAILGFTATYFVQELLQVIMMIRWGCKHATTWRCLALLCVTPRVTKPTTVCCRWLR
jgi:hypothetical protein